MPMTLAPPGPHSHSEATATYQSHPIFKPGGTATPFRGKGQMLWRSMAGHFRECWRRRSDTPAGCVCLCVCVCVHVCVCVRERKREKERKRPSSTLHSSSVLVSLHIKHSSSVSPLSSHTSELSILSLS